MHHALEGVSHTSTVESDPWTPGTVGGNEEEPTNLRNVFTASQDDVAHKNLEGDDDLKEMIRLVYEKSGTDIGHFWISFLEMSDPLVQNIDACHVGNGAEYLSSTYDMLPWLMATLLLPTDGSLDWNYDESKLEVEARLFAAPVEGEAVVLYHENCEQRCKGEDCGYPQSQVSPSSQEACRMSTVKNEERRESNPGHPSMSRGFWCRSLRHLFTYIKVTSIWSYCHTRLGYWLRDRIFRRPSSSGDSVTGASVYQERASHSLSVCLKGNISGNVARMKMRNISLKSSPGDASLVKKW